MIKLPDYNQIFPDHQACALCGLITENIIENWHYLNEEQNLCNIFCSKECADEEYKNCN